MTETGYWDKESYLSVGKEPKLVCKSERVWGGINDCLHLCTTKQLGNVNGKHHNWGLSSSPGRHSRKQDIMTWMIVTGKNYLPDLNKGLLGNLSRWSPIPTSGRTLIRFNQSIQIQLTTCGGNPQTCLWTTELKGVIKLEEQSYMAS